VASLAARFARGHQDQIVVVQFTPTAHIRIAKLKEIDWAIVIAMPAEWQDSLLPRVDLNERSWTNMREDLLSVRSVLSQKDEFGDFRIVFEHWHEIVGEPGEFRKTGFVRLVHVRNSICLRLT
jgi:hypothetical protein